MEPNLLAQTALYAWPLAALALFRALLPHAAIAIVLLGGALLLPSRVAIEVQGFPDLDRHTVPVLSALVCALLFARRRVVAVRPAGGIERLVLVLLAGAVVTAAGNRDPLRFGPVMLPGMTAWAAVSLATEILITLWAPFYLGRAFYRRPHELTRLLALVAVAGALYSLPILFELRMSPQLHRLVYGFHQHAFSQTIRGEGWRPMVFMSHGLQLAFFVFTAATAATGLWRIGFRPLGLPAGWVAAWLALLLFGVRSLAAAAYGAVALPVVALLRPRVQVGLAAAVVALTLAYPVLRGMDLFPTSTVVGLAAGIDEARAGSLETRFAYEDQLLARARERPWFGWGTFARNRVYDVETGENRSVTDGDWIIRLGTQGAVGMAATLCLLLGPVLSAFRRLHRVPSGSERMAVATAAWIVACVGVDLLPNAMLTPVHVLICGALAGVMEGARRSPASRPGTRARQSSRIGATGGSNGTGSGGGAPTGVQAPPS